MALQHLRSSTANKRPIPTVMSSGQVAINTNEASPGLFFKDSNGDLVKVGPVHIGTTAPNSSPASTAATALVAGTTYQILTVGTTDFTLVGASSNTVGVIFTATGAGTGTGTVSGQQGVEKGEQWLDTTGGTYVLKIYDGTAWRSESGTFVDVNGDTMTGALLLDNAASASAPDLSFDGDADTGIYSPAADELGIATAGTERMLIDSSGNVGIGTTSPSNVLSLDDTQASGGVGIDITNQGDGGTSTTPYVFINAKLNSVRPGGEIRFGREGVYGSESTADSFMAFYTAVNSTNTERMRIDSSGRVGIGQNISSVLGYELQITDKEGTDPAILGLDVSGNDTRLTAYAGSGNSCEMAFRTQNAGATSEKMRIDSSGRVGIGTTSPDDFLTIADTSTSGDIGLRFKGDASSRQFIMFGDPGGVQLGDIMYDHGTNALRFRTNNVERMRIDSSGRVGIDCLDPQAALEVSTSSADYRIQFTHVGGQNFIRSLNPDHVTYQSLFYDAAQHLFYTSNSEKARIDSSGRLLVGTPSNFGGGSLQVANNSINIGTFIGAVTGAYELIFEKSRSSTVGIDTLVGSTDTLGQITFKGGDGSKQVQAALITAKVDGTPGADDMPARLMFSTTADGASSPTERMRIFSSSANAVGIGKTTTASTDGNTGILHIGNISPFTSYIKSLSGTANGILFYHNTTYVGGLNYTNTGTALATSSDYRLKENVVSVPNAITRAKQLNPVQFNFISEPEETVEGFIAHEVGEVVPEACFGEKDAVDEDGNIKPQAIAQEKLIPLLTAALQEAIAKIETLEAKVAALEAR